jgi:DNA-binding PadR family transcriptional regulator
MKALETRSGGVCKVSAGTMYPTLAQLEDEGMVVSEHGRRVEEILARARHELEAL